MARVRVFLREHVYPHTPFKWVEMDEVKAADLVARRCAEYEPGGPVPIPEAETPTEGRKRSIRSK